MRQILNDGDTIVCCYAKPAHGPGWSNKPLWLIVQSRSGVLRQECLQPEEQTADMHLIYDVAAATHDVLLWAANRLANPLLEGRK